MDSFFAMLKEFGPFTAPLCIAMGWAIRWLITDRQRMQDELKAAHEDSRNTRDKRTEDQRTAAKEFREYSDAIAHRLEEWSKRVDRMSLQPGADHGVDRENAGEVASLSRTRRDR